MPVRAHALLARLFRRVGICLGASFVKYALLVAAGRVTHQRSLKTQPAIAAAVRACQAKRNTSSAGVAWPAVSDKIATRDSMVPSTITVVNLAIAIAVATNVGHSMTGRTRSGALAALRGLPFGVQLACLQATFKCCSAASV